MKQTDKTIQNKKSRRTLSTVLAVLGILLAAAVVVMGLVHFLPGEEEPVLQARSAVARSGVITSSIHAGGPLTDAESTATDIPQGVELEFVVDDGDAVFTGDLIAVVDKTSVLLTIDTLQTRMEALDEKIRTAMDESVSADITVPVAGRVKDIHVTEGQDVTEAMYEHGSILLLSLDGYMAVEVEWPGVTVGTAALVTLSGGDTYSGRVASIAGTSAVVIFSDYGPRKGDTASVTDSDGNDLGEGEVYIHSELAITGYYGFVEDIHVSEEELVELGDELVTLSDTTDTASYAGLLAERAIMEQQLQLLFTLHETGGIYADMDGYIVETNTGESNTTQNQNMGFPGFMGMANYGSGHTVTLLGAESETTPEPAPEPTPEPTAEPTPDPTAEPTPIPSPEVTEAPAPTETPIPSDNPTPTEEPSGEIPSQPTATPGTPEETPDGDTTPVPTETPVNPFPTDGTEVTPTPEPTPEGTPTPVTPNMPTYDRGYTFALAEATAVSGYAFGGSGYTLTLTIYDPQTTDTDTNDASGEAGEDMDTGSDAGDASGEADTSSSFITSAQDYTDADTLRALLAQKSYAAAYTVGADTLVYTWENGGWTKDTASALKSGDLLVFVFEDEAMTQLLFIVRHPAPETDADTDSDTSASGEMSSTTTGSFPTTGTMGAMGTVMGQTQQSASALEEFQAFAITPDTDMTVSLTIDEMDIGRIALGMEIDLALDAITGETYTATVTDIGGTDANSDGSGGAKYAVEVTLSRTRDMRSGMNAAATIVLSTAEAEVTVPVAALCEEGAKTVVYTGFDPDTGELLNPMEVTCGLSDGFTVEILEGLAAGDTVYYFYEEEYAMDFTL